MSRRRCSRCRLGVYYSPFPRGVVWVGWKVVGISLTGFRWSVGRTWAEGEGEKMKEMGMFMGALSLDEVGGGTRMICLQ